ncbi:MAG: hypothetical protein SFV19_03905 [Rhodospirillaceae bacterium]|nr:hypothetical protein [Rhodospirillaceae bacterium]
MNSNAMAPEPALPSPRKLAVACLTSLVVALVLLVTAVLPVEYGLDPLGTGRMLGLLREAPVDAAAVDIPQGDQGLTPSLRGDVALYGGLYRTDAVEFVIEPYDYLEFKYRLEQGAAMLFSWAADGTLIHEFHGDPDANPQDVRSYDKSDKSMANGSFVAPVTGIHGWFWENPGNTPITLRLASSGFYAEAVEFRSDKSRNRRDVSPAPMPASTQSPASAQSGE